jgi:hypothetical protein
MPQPFVDYYETLQLNQNANAETVERVYRLLAKRYHPDNSATGNAELFAAVCDAFDILSDPVKRAEYDVRYDDQRTIQWQIFDQTSAADTREEDRRIFHGILSLLYAARRRDAKHGGLGSIYLEKMLGCPHQHLEFHIWYLKERGWIQVLDTGQYAITADGVDRLGQREMAVPAERLLPASTAVGEGADVEMSSAADAVSRAN